MLFRSTIGLICLRWNGWRLCRYSLTRGSTCASNTCDPGSLRIPRSSHRPMQTFKDCIGLSMNVQSTSKQLYSCVERNAQIATSVASLVDITMVNTTATRIISAIAIVNSPKVLTTTTKSHADYCTFSPPQMYALSSLIGLDRAGHPGPHM